MCKMKAVKFIFTESGGPSWDLPLGRRDSKSASVNGSNTNSPPPIFNFTEPHDTVQQARAG